jgi:hypothetical protein
MRTTEKLLPILAMALAAGAFQVGCSSGGGDGGGDDDGGGGKSSSGNIIGAGDDGDGSDDGDGDGSGDSSGSGSGDSCESDCQDFGFASGEQQDETCVCDGPTDDACFTGMSAICVCNDSIGEPCTDDEAFNLYVNCYQDNDGAREPITCVAGYVDENNQIDCDAAVACFPD